MRTFHSGGSAVTADITQGLPRVEEIFEARKPKGECVLSEVAGRVKIKQDQNITSSQFHLRKVMRNMKSKSLLCLQLKMATC